MMNWEKYGIDVHKVRGSQGKTTCPQCSHDRKHKSDPCLSVDKKTGLFNCHNCGFSGCAIEHEKPKKDFVKPQPRLEKLGPRALRFFEHFRKISNNTLLRFNITEANEWMPQANAEVTAICFNYYRAGELVNIKFRGPEKAFKLAKDAELIFYNLDAIDGHDEVIICEGEIDCLSFHESGIYNSVSVPNGASKGNQKLEYLDNCWSAFEGKKRIVLAVDNDAPGESLKNELARRLGKDRCFTVTYPEGCKDANEVLIKHGPEAVRKLVECAEEWPLEGISTVEDFFDDIEQWYDHGYPESPKPGIRGFDHMISFGKGMLTVVTGIPGHGKDEVMNLIMDAMATNHDWRWGIAPFEESEKVTTTKLIEKHAGKSFAFRKDPANRMTKEQFQRGALFAHDHYYFLNTDEIERGQDALFQKFGELVARKGINAIVINPWNCIEHKIPPGQSETLYISEFLTSLIAMLKRYDLHGFLIAHPAKMQKAKDTGRYEVPTLYSISGSANFFNKTHNGISIYRDYESNITTVYFQKIKQSWDGQIGWSSFNYDTMTRQYSYLESSVPIKEDHTHLLEPGIPEELPPGNWSPMELEYTDYQEDD